MDVYGRIRKLHMALDWASRPGQGEGTILCTVCLVDVQDAKSSSPAVVSICMAAPWLHRVVLLGAAEHFAPRRRSGQPHLFVERLFLFC